jgi:glycosyltransferase involved in cell wall biosynthesis
MRIVQLGPYPPPHGGVQTNLVAIRDYLNEHEHSCAVINITRHRKPECAEVYYPKNAIELIWRLFRKRYDVVHLHIGGRIPLRVVALAFSATCVPWAKAILTLHSGGYPSFQEARELHRNSVLAFVFRRFDGVIGVNREMMQFFWRLGVSKSRTKLIQPQSVARMKMADCLIEPLASFFKQHDRVLVSVCGLEPEYDVQRQIRAMPQVLRTFPKAGLAIIGSGSLEARLREQIAATPYAQHVLLCGDVPHDVTLRAIADGDVLLRTTLYDGDAISVREALYLGTPVIATDNGMRPGGVDLIPIGDTEALRDAIERRLNARKAKRALVPGDEENLAEVLKLYCQASRVRSA